MAQRQITKTIANPANPKQTKKASIWVGLPEGWEIPSKTNNKRVARAKLAKLLA